MKLRNTLQRSLVLDAANALHHPTADDVYDRITADYPTVSRGTVYRNLNVLVQLGQLRKVSVPGGADCFDSTLREHYHIRCKSCGEVADVSLPYQAGLIDTIVDTNGFLIQDHDIVLGGVCPACRVAAERQNSVHGENPTQTKINYGG